MTAMTEAVTLPRSLITRLLTEAQSEPEREVCGLVGRQDNRYHYYPVTNVAEAPGRLFRMDPREQIDALRAMRQRGETLFAIFHSHPHGPARPSVIDLAEAAYPEAVYLIASLGTAGVLELAGYRLEDGRARPLELHLSP